MFKKFILLDQAGGGTGDGGGGGTALTSGQAGAPAPAAGQSGTPAGTGNGNNPPASGTPAAGTGSQDWRSTLPPELQEDASIKKYSDVSSLARAYVSAQKLIGADKINVPGKHATPEDWKNVYTKLGLPADAKDYKIELDKESKVSADFLQAFTPAAHEMNLLPHQAKGVLNWLEKFNTEGYSKAKQQMEQRVASELDGLKKEWGAAYDQKFSYAAKVAQDAGPDFLKYLDETGAGNDVRMIKFLNSIGEKTIKEGTIIEGGNPNKALSPAEAQDEINKIMGDSKNPYFDKSHPGHRAAVDEVQRLFSLAHPPKK